MSKALIITSIADDKHPILNQFASECKYRNIPFIVIGDSKSPEKFYIDGCDFWDIKRQQELPFKLAKTIPLKHYSRKNLGYLIAIKNGAVELAETDDDNIPHEEFWLSKSNSVKSFNFIHAGWVNVYSYFTEKTIWPRGFPLEELQNKPIEISSIKQEIVNCPIHQGLADENPDVDAVYRLTYPLPINFEKKIRLSLSKNSWSPFNSQNTYWFKEAFMLMYLPSYCSFRMTDIWRSYIAQRIAWENNWSVLYHEPTVYQVRNEHNLMRDFEDEISGYTNNLNICKELQSLQLKSGKEHIAPNLKLCYQKLIDIQVIGREEMPLLEAWIHDVQSLI